MNKKELKIEFLEYDSENELNAKEQELLVQARNIADSAYAPYSQFYVGAALLLKNGEIITENNQENVAYPSGLCAERVAIYAAGLVGLADKQLRNTKCAINRTLK